MEVFVKQPLKSCEDVSVLVVACDELAVIETCAVIKERLDAVCDEVLAVTVYRMVQFILLVSGKCVYSAILSDFMH